jgi:D-alanyl-D-alanine endopeptidase (penicillin-binding protein 7)
MVNLTRRIILASVACVLMASQVDFVYAAQKKTTAKKAQVSSQKLVKKSTVKSTKLLKKVAKKGKLKSKKVVVFNAVERPSAGDKAGLKNSPDPLFLKSNAALVIDQSNSEVLFDKNSNIALPIASITKLMTSLVVVEAKQNLNEILEITDEDLDREKGTGSRLAIGSKLSRADLLHIALMSSENRAASALGRHYPGGLQSFVAAMNAKAKSIGMTDTHFVDSSGLSSKNVASAQDLAKLINEAHKHPVIREYSTDTHYVVQAGRRAMEYSTTNQLVKDSAWNIGLQKTGYIAEAGRCLVMYAVIGGRNVVMVFLDSKGKYSRLADAGRIKQWIQNSLPSI